MEKENTGKSDAALKEEAVLKFWQDNKIFEKTLEKEAPKGEFVFFEGPPTANAKPALHHLEARAFKDVIPRYKTMQGFHVARQGGWDTHGLPVELQIEKKLGLTSKKDIETYGVEKFNRECKNSVFEYIKDWEDFTDRIGYWVDKKNAYFTFNTNYIESLWNVFSKVNDRGLLYKDYRIVPWCSRCGTSLASHELAQGYEDVKDLSIFVKFKVVGEENTYFLAWTTTPWTLPGNVALAVGGKIDYVKTKVGEEILIVAKTRLEVLNEGFEIIEEIKGSDLAGLSYEPLYNFITPNEKSHKVYAGDFVTTEDGTGVVHIAPMYGQDDFELGTKVGLPKEHVVGLDGKFLPDTGFFSGRFAMEKDENGKPTLAVDVIKDLTARGLFFDKKNYEHTYPHCWRCKTPLIYYARDSWYIRMTELRDELVKENQDINWEPSHIRDGRFGEWLKDIKDWAISRERYWGTPMPVWVADDGEKLVVDSIETLKKYTKKSGNKYFVMRHGEGEHNISGIARTRVDDDTHLTDNGRVKATSSAKDLKDRDITAIYVSPLIRTRETAEIVADIIGLPKDKIVIDERIKEIDAGVWNGKPFSFTSYFNTIDSYETPIEGGESPMDVKRRVGDFLNEINSKHKDENILIVSHGIFFEVVDSIVDGLDKEKSLEKLLEVLGKYPPGTYREFDFIPIPHNEYYELDLHRPFIDDVVLEKDGKTFIRVKEVLDVWFDSGAMPFAQHHYPFENKEYVDGDGYPADFISEAVDQTRGWFYTLHAVGILMGKGKAYKNCICLGHILDSKGKKMSKSIGNIVNPWEMMDKYGVDTLRLWMYSVNQPGDSKNFDEKTVAEIHGKIFTLISNCHKFYETYVGEMKAGFDPTKSPNVLDQWILSKLAELVKEGTEKFDSYKVFEPARALRDFVSELSTWYIRRSRDRFKGDDESDKQFALATTKHVFTELAKYMAPMTPFFAEDLYKKAGGEKESVHLESWPVIGKINQEVLAAMLHAKNFVTMGLEQRQKAGIKVRQPLSKLAIKHNAPPIPLWNEISQIIADEVNVKEVTLENLGQDQPPVLLDANITDDLKREGDFREFLRGVQGLRKDNDLSPNDLVTLAVPESSRETILGFEAELKKVAGIREIVFADAQSIQLKK